MSALKRIKRSLRGCRFKLSLGLLSFEEEFCLDFFGFLIALPFLDRWHSEPREMVDRWGIYYADSAFVRCWGVQAKFTYMPWMWDHFSWEVRRADGTWKLTKSAYDDAEKEVQEFPYQYQLKNGEIQHVTATVYVKRGVWLWRWCPGLKWLKKLEWPRLCRQSIEVRFSSEIGERTGSWKGGCVGCGYDMLPGESMEDTLRRMERDRKF